MALAFKYADKAAFLKRLRERFDAAKRADAWRLAALLKRHYDAGDFTAADLRAAFGGITAAQLTALASRLTTMANKWADLKSAKGE